ncbi:HutD/Ves family protein [Roseixanthobacter glucoisosaccharinicivorans]|uniref:HutD/Ves family protein n=1 Tax=Roseixanthobacter glucoisosaccharinicivorans TaxID=3119923 RepID=UPI0037286466
MRIVRAADCRRMAWKNGGGETVEILTVPEGAGLSDFDWRISSATVASAGPFSAFAGIDRTLCVLSGEGLTLAVPPHAPVRLDPASAPYRFPGEAAVFGTPHGGPVVDLNIMTRRARFTHEVTRLTLDAPLSVPSAGADVVIFVVQGAVSEPSFAESAASSVALEAGDCALLSPQDEMAVLTPLGGACEIIMVRITPA